MVSTLALMLDRRWWQQRDKKDLCTALIASAKIAMDQGPPSTRLLPRARSALR